jgi:hypothetical protein
MKKDIYSRNIERDSAECFSDNDTPLEKTRSFRVHILYASITKLRGTRVS